MSVLVFLDHFQCKMMGSREEAPYGSVCFSSPEELGLAASAQSLDKIRRKLLGENIEKSSSSEEAARRLWYVLSLNPPAPANLNKHERRKDKLGNNKIQDTSKIELLQCDYVPGKDSMRDFFYNKLAPQGKQLLDFLLKDGRGIWTGEEAEAIMAARADEIVTKQPKLTVIRYYKAELIRKGLLRRRTFAEMAEKMFPQTGDL